MTNRNSKIPRPFSFKGIGKGDIIEEAAVEYKDWAPAIQILHFTKGRRTGQDVLRFCYYVESGQLANRALWIDDNDIEDLKKEIKENKRVRELLQRLLE